MSARRAPPDLAELEVATVGRPRLRKLAGWSINLRCLAQTARQDGGIQPMELLDWSERSVQTYKNWLGFGGAGTGALKYLSPGRLALRTVLGDTLGAVTILGGLAVYGSISLGLYGKPVYYNYNTSLISQWMFPPPASMANSLASGASPTAIRTLLWSANSGFRKQRLQLFGGYSARRCIAIP